MSSTRKDFQIEENVTTFKPGNVFMMKKSHVYIVTGVIALLFVGSILATYFGKPGKLIRLYII